MGFLMKLWMSQKDWLGKLAMAILTMFVGRVAEELWSAASEEVAKAELSGKDGVKKFELAYEGIKDRIDIREIPEFLLNLAIEIAVAKLNLK